MADGNRCIAIVSAPPWHTHTYQCAANGKYEIGGARVCGTHLRVAKRWEEQGRLETMMAHWWGLGGRKAEQPAAVAAGESDEGAA